MARPGFLGIIPAEYPDPNEGLTTYLPPGYLESRMALKGSRASREPESGPATNGTVSDQPSPERSTSGATG